ncbi:hypothetical protein WM05_06835 [Burkholderia ubonensis]|uniref:hypothetical protein n=1 Tax=Burkholderia ubonensis TaxID=101571 RepID=UPI000753A714|nr:hypothetical protein [Burkholderia ubonensis]KWI56518.1 hypothetical protein WM05_06835 [Burkholderia ubonensis]
MDVLSVERRMTTAIAAITVLTGAAQVLVPAALAALIAAAPPDGLGAQLFATRGSVYIWNAHALPRERPLARRATPRILDVFARSATRRAAVLVATPNLNFIPRECPKSPVWRRRASLVWLGQTALLAPCPTSDFGHSHVRSICKQTLGMFMVLFGGSLLHAQRATGALSVVLLWGACQKLLAAAFVAWGVMHGVFVYAALLVAAFDGASGLLYLDLRRRGG